jgi:hypothetical protein
MQTQHRPNIIGYSIVGKFGFSLKKWGKFWGFDLDSRNVSDFEISAEK